MQVQFSVSDSMCLLASLECTLLTACPLSDGRHNSKVHAHAALCNRGVMARKAA